MSSADTTAGLTCRRCGGALEVGYVIEELSAYQATEVWVEGEPESTRRGWKLEGRRKLPVTSYRCVACGQLEFFAVAPA